MQSDAAPPRSADSSNSHAASPRVRAWSDYWASGAPHSLPGSLPADGGPDLARFWQPWFAALAPASRLLDIGTGSGILVRIALASRRDWSAIEAIDLVAERPPVFPQAPGLRFHPGVAAEQLPFADASLDAAASQFGIEYAKPGLAGAELSRVLTPNGRVAFLLHHHQSLPVLHARAEQAQFEWLFGEPGLIAAARRVLPYFAELQQPGGKARLAMDSGAIRARRDFNQAMAEAERRAGEAGGDLCEDARGLFVAVLMAAQQDPSLGQQQLDLALRRLEDARLRSQELLDCALDAEAARALVLACGRTEVELREVDHAGQLLGWFAQGSGRV